MYAVIEFWHTQETSFEPVTEHITAIGWRQQPDGTWKLVIETDSPEIVRRVDGGEVLDVDLYELVSHVIGIRARAGDVLLSSPSVEEFSNHIRR